MRNEKYLSYEAYQKCCIFEGWGCGVCVCVGGGGGGGEVTAHQDYFTYFELNHSLDGAKTGDP